MLLSSKSQYHYNWDISIINRYYRLKKQEGIDKFRKKSQGKYGVLCPFGFHQLLERSFRWVVGQIHRIPLF